MAVQSLSVQDIYTRAGRTQTTSTRATAGAAPGVPRQGVGDQGPPPDLARAFAVSVTSRPLYGVAFFALALIGLQLLARNIGTEQDFREIRLSVYNVIVIGFAAILGILFWKVVLIKVPIPHLTPAVLAV